MIEVVCRRGGRLIIAGEACQARPEKQSPTLSAAELAALGAWLNLPWTIKVVFGEIIDSVTMLGSQRRGYVDLGAAAVALWLGVLAAAAAERLPALSAEAPRPSSWGWAAR